MNLLSFSEFLNEGLYDKGSHKVVYLVGGPGSGKSFVVKGSMGGLGLKRVDSDTEFERRMKKQGLPTTPENIYSPKGQAIRDGAKKVVAGQESLYKHNRLGMIIDGTGKDFDKIKTHSENMRNLGYETHMVFVNTSLDKAKERNRLRDRALPDSEVESMHSTVRNNLGRFQSHFGNNFHIVDNTDSGEDNQKTLLKLHKKVRSIVNTPAQTPEARRWREAQRSAK